MLAALFLAKNSRGAATLLRPACVRYVQSSGGAKDPAHPEPVPLPKLKDSFLDGTSSTYLEELEERYRRDPGSVDRTWASFFKSLDTGVPAEAIAEAYDAFEKGSTTSPFTTAALSQQTAQESMKLLQLVRAYEVMGHFHAQLDPLGLDKRKKLPELDPAYYGFTDADMDREFFLGTFGLSGFLSDQRPTRTLREVLRRLQETYCGTIGFEYMHIPDRDRCNWLRDRIETIEKVEFSKAKKLHTLDRLAWSEMFESFLANKYTAAKRFGLEGGESLIPGMKALIDRAADLGVECVVLGMPHRGRLNVLGNVVRKPLAQIFGEFSGAQPDRGEASWFGTGDVKYHLGTSYDRPTISGKRVHLSLLANPSHLEAVNTVVLGKVRAKQFLGDDNARSRIMGLLMHGDGSFSGQGIVFETLDLSQLPDYTTGGTIHVVVNNQVAFTTDPKESRSSPYCTDVGKSIDAPIFHVNADDVEAVIRVFELAAEWRQAWKTDVIIDLVCYRKHGHNEIDEPMFTQPLMYSAIKNHKSTFEQYKQELLADGSATEKDIQELTDKINHILSEEFANAKAYEPKPSDWLASHWHGFLSPGQKARIRNTGVPMELLRSVGDAITTLPSDFHAHKMIRKIYDLRHQMVVSGEGIDWGTAEALAFGTLISEGFHVRLSGQDVERGTFSHRHAVLHDQKTGEKYIPLNNVYPGQKPNFFTVSNSSLSEFGVLGFELGYSMENPNSLVIWEAQFGDFANGAQIMFDQFISSGEAKWLRQTGLVCLLPHGYDGQGPEHSSARLERFLQMADEQPYTLPNIDESKWFTGGHLGSQIQECNWQVANVTTPANYFHLLRRQIHRQFRKPLIVMAPKNLLRHPKCKSGLWEFDDVPDDKNIVGVRFKRLIMDDSAEDRSPYPPVDDSKKRVVFCSGKLYYELHAERAKQGKEQEVALVRIEQLAPFPFDLVMREMRRYPNAHYMWAQEEPWNMGAYTFIKPRFETCLRALDRTFETPLPYAGRPPMAATATGFGQTHQREQANLINQALDLSFGGVHTL